MTKPVMDVIRPAIAVTSAAMPATSTPRTSPPAGGAVGGSLLLAGGLLLPVGERLGVGCWLVGEGLGVGFGPGGGALGVGVGTTTLGVGLAPGVGAPSASKMKPSAATPNVAITNPIKIKRTPRRGLLRSMPIL